MSDVVDRVWIIDPKHGQMREWVLAADYDAVMKRLKIAQNAGYKLALLVNFYKVVPPKHEFEVLWRDMGINARLVSGPVHEPRTPKEPEQS